MATESKDKTANVGRRGFLKAAASRDLTIGIAIQTQYR
jgi:hypothetical protein